MLTLHLRLGLPGGPFLQISQPKTCTVIQVSEESTDKNKEDALRLNDFTDSSQCLTLHSPLNDSLYAGAHSDDSGHF
jgi:hypothetical protein